MRISTHKSGTILAAHILKKKEFYFLISSGGDYQNIQNVHIRRLVSILSGFFMSHPEFPEFQLMIKNFQNQIWSFTSDPEFPFQIWKFYIWSRISYSYPELPFQTPKFQLVSLECPPFEVWKWDACGLEWSKSGKGRYHYFRSSEHIFQVGKLALQYRKYQIFHI